MLDKKYSVEIPEWYLLTIATWGNLGDNELPELMQLWAEKECNRLGLKEKLSAERKLKLEILTQRMKRTLGNELTEEITDYVNQAVDKFKDSI
jgi:hypothetical protein